MGAHADSPRSGIPPCGGRLPELLDVEPGIVPPLDPAFRPAVLANRRYREIVERSGMGVPLVIGLERENGLLSRFETRVLPPEEGHREASYFHVERLVKFLLWARGGWRVYMGGPAPLAEHIRRLYAPDGARAFDVDLMRRVYERPFQVVPVRAEDVPPPKEEERALGGHMDGCRIGFDLGASDYKVAAVIDGRAVFSEETPWNPKDQADPAYHERHIRAALERAASHLPRVDAIGGSAAGVYVDNRAMVASLFRSVPPDAFARTIKTLFLRLREEWDVPLQVVNDGDVTALAGALSLGETALLGIAMGSSEAAGYLNGKGRITGWLNELAFAPIDYNPAAPPDEWSGDRGAGVLYFSQQAVDKLAPAAGLSFPAEMGLPERLRDVQARTDRGDEAARRIFETIGIYLGYAIPHYAEFYDIRNLLLLGRVTSGRGGEILVSGAGDVLKRAFPEIAERIALHVPDERSRRVGQAVAAASLPVLARIRA